MQFPGCQFEPIACCPITGYHKPRVWLHLTRWPQTIKELLLLKEGGLDDISSWNGWWWQLSTLLQEAVSYSLTCKSWECSITARATQASCTMEFKRAASVHVKARISCLNTGTVFAKGSLHWTVFLLTLGKICPVGSLNIELQLRTEKAWKKYQYKLCFRFHFFQSPCHAYGTRKQEM